MHKVRSTVKELLIQSQLLQQEKHTREIRNMNTFVPGQLVYVTHIHTADVTTNNRKFSMGLAGPFIIREQATVRPFVLITLQGAIIGLMCTLTKFFLAN